EVHRIAKGWRRAVIVLRCDEEERVSSLDPRAPVTRVLVRVLTKPGMGRLVHEREGELQEVDKVDLPVGVSVNVRSSPLCDGQSDRSWSNGADDDHQLRNVNSPLYGRPLCGRRDSWCSGRLLGFPGTIKLRVTDLLRVSRTCAQLTSP